MVMKRKSIWVAGLGVLMIVAGCIMSFVTSFAKDVSAAKENAEIIDTEYKSFKELIESFNGERELLYSNVFNDLYIENVAESYQEWTSAFESYEGVLKKIAGYRPVLEERCLGVLYNDSNIQSRCDSMLISFETAINYYVKDVNKFNEVIDLYNAGVDELTRVASFDLDGYNYLDFNDDGKYLGK